MPRITRVLDGPKFFLLSLLLTGTLAFTSGFSSSYHPFVSSRPKLHPVDTFQGGRLTIRPSSSDPNNNEPNPSRPIDRFINPRIDDIGLPLADALNAQVVAPAFEVFFLSLTHSAFPTWLKPIFDSTFPLKGSLLAPTLVHGAGLASCWLAGALAAKAYESEAFDISEGKGYGVPIFRIFQAGAFAIGILILSTQLDLFFEYGRWVQVGESESIDLRIYTAFVEVFDDVVAEAIVLSGWRIYRASLTGARDNEY
mmetsp:Transcript_2474/g.3725  ORF Transcript_2474/g.3725 Transcript_2474/m.3725 type:complete len:254 (-) Transcript_2474:465-1226(-)|eukprot:CAMPEP_0195529218 /NCGR_PEP_ID=MMETSP0794_2-20130614/31682_1 /TAXON_ID=515487 /ORGANISM="Stephanopyxis turris, Strain CCMP 815" /LENGTH=253 /DNA_ID=CAMNT_0040660489 /DNA_START=59 /DNA_END=820 /DNA_ORIENTATION=-